MLEVSFGSFLLGPYLSKRTGYLARPQNCSLTSTPIQNRDVRAVCRDDSDFELNVFFRVYSCLLRYLRLLLFKLIQKLNSTGRSTSDRKRLDE